MVATFMPWLSEYLAFVTISSFFLYFLTRAIYHIFLSPLSVIPGPWYAAISNFWLMTHVLRLEQCKIVQVLFDTYGPVVRVGPNKVVFCDLGSMKNVYSVHKFDKSSYYKSLLTNNNDHAMTTLEHALHVTRRKGYAPHYTLANLALFQPEIHDFTLELLHILDSIAGKTSIDCLAFFRHFMVDVIVTSSHGHRHDALRKWATGVEDRVCTAISDFPKRGILRSAVPKWAWKFVCHIPNNRWRILCDSDKIMSEFVSARVYEMRAQMDAGKLTEDAEKPKYMLDRLLRHKYNGSNELMPDLDIISEAMGHMVAGSDTTSISISYFFWELSRRPEIMTKLQAELDHAMPDPRVIPDFPALQKLPYLDAFIKEGLRIYGAGPSLLERVVPPSTCKDGSASESFDLMGYALPAGTIVATQGWSMHRDAVIFPSPSTFLPDRWLETPPSSFPDAGNGDRITKMQQHFMPFGTGSRVCGGQNLAMIMLRVTVAAVARNFNVVANPVETNERSMEIKDSFVIFPAAMECKLSFQPRI